VIPRIGNKTCIRSCSKSLDFRSEDPGDQVHTKKPWIRNTGSNRHERSICLQRNTDFAQGNQSNCTHLMPKSMCSWMPNPKFPLAEKFSFLSSYSLTLKPRSRISSAFAPLHKGPPFSQEQEKAVGHRYKFKPKCSTFNVFHFTIKLLGKSIFSEDLLPQPTQCCTCGSRIQIYPSRI
jgi:hypothetical protein